MSTTRRRLSHRRFDLRLEGDMTEDEARAVVDKVLATPGDRLAFVTRRPGKPPREDGKPQRLFVKAEFRRPDQTLAKRLRRGRAVREGRGLRFFAQAGITVPPLLLFGEQSRLLPRACALVCTQKLKGLDAGRRYARDPDPELPVLAMRALAEVHAKGFVHGDAVFRNFLPSGGRTYVIDLPSWGRWSAERALHDLTRLLGSTRKRGVEQAEAADLLDVYVRAAPDASGRLPDGWRESALAGAQEFLDYLLERDATREDRHARRESARLRSRPRDPRP